MSGHKMFTEEQLAKVLCLFNNIDPVDANDGSPNWWMFADVARKMIAAVDKPAQNPPPRSANGLEGHD